MFSSALVQTAQEVNEIYRAAPLKRIVTAESCTGGLLGGLLTEIAGSSDIFERGFITYSNEAKIELLGVAAAIIDSYGAVSAQTAAAMTQGALARSRADVALSVTGIAGPGGGNATKPVGLVYLCVHQRGGDPQVSEQRFGNPGRSIVRQQTLECALHLLLGMRRFL